MVQKQKGLSGYCSEYAVTVNPFALKKRVTHTKQQIPNIKHLQKLELEFKHINAVWILTQWQTQQSKFQHCR